MLSVGVFCLLDREKAAVVIKNFYDNLEKFLIKDANICDNVEINGVINSNYNSLREKINAFCERKDLDLNVLKDDVLDDIWIKDVYIKKVLPNKLTIEIVEYYPFAVFFDGKKYNLIDQFGNNIAVNETELYKFNNLLQVSGDGFEEEVNSFFNLLSAHDNITKNLYKIERIGKRRWNLTLKNRILIQLPEEDENIFETWNILEKVLGVYGLSANLISIDLRIRDRVYLQYDDAHFPSIVEIK
jgi:cell division protein FtsQ